MSDEIKRFALKILILTSAIAVLGFMFFKADQTLVFEKNDFYPPQYLNTMGYWKILNRTTTTIDTVNLTVEADSSIFTYTVDGINYRRKTGKLIIYNIDDVDTLFIAFPSAPGTFTRVYPDGGSITFTPAYLDTIYVKGGILGVATLDYDILFTVADTTIGG